MKYYADFELNCHVGVISAGVTQLVECDLAKVDVAGSNPVSRSKLFLHSIRMLTHGGSAGRPSELLNESRVVRG